MVFSDNFEFFKINCKDYGSIGSLFREMREKNLELDESNDFQKTGFFQGRLYTQKRNLEEIDKIICFVKNIIKKNFDYLINLQTKFDLYSLVEQLTSDTKEIASKIDEKDII